MAREKTTAELLIEYVGRSNTALGAGKWSLQAVCRLCQREENFKARMQVVRDPRFIRKAAMKFSEGGWTVNEGAICPSCSKSA